MNDVENRSGNIITKAIIPLLLLFLSFPFILSMTASYNAIIKLQSGKYLNGKNIIINGNIMIGRVSDTEYKTRKRALARADEDTEKRSWTYLRMEKISFIELKHQKKEQETDTTLPTRFFGTYRINAEGNIGYLYLWEKNGRTFGTIRFPNYASGVYETLKNVKIKNRKISFTRSATTGKEIKRIGVSTFFKQEYSGWYNSKGTYIKGQYVIPGSIRNWKAYKIKK